MNLPNLLTLSRIPLMGAIAALLQVPGELAGPAAVAALVLFGLGGLTDWLDGWLARKRGQVTAFGVYMDALTDKIFILGLLIVLVDLDRAPLGPVLVILVREFVITGLRLLAAVRAVVIPAEKAGKQKTVTQIAGVALLLLALALERGGFGAAAEAAEPAVQALGLIVFLASTVLTATSALLYLRRHGGLLAS